MSIGLPVSVAILLRAGPGQADGLRRLFQSRRWSLLLIIAMLLIVVVAPIPALTGLVRLASAEGFRWPVDGWIVYLTALLSDAALIALIWSVFRSRGTTAAQPSATRATAVAPR